MKPSDPALRQCSAESPPGSRPRRRHPDRANRPPGVRAAHRPDHRRQAYASRERPVEHGVDADPLQSPRRYSGAQSLPWPRGEETKRPGFPPAESVVWLRGQDLNLRPLGHENPSRVASSRKEAIKRDSIGYSSRQFSLPVAARSLHFRPTWRVAPAVTRSWSPPGSEFYARVDSPDVTFFPPFAPPNKGWSWNLAATDGGSEPCPPKGDSMRPTNTEPRSFSRAWPC